MKAKSRSVYTLVVLVLCLFALSSCEQETYMQGKRLYEAHCNNCHMEDGIGLAKLIPPLANSDYLKDNQDKIACILRNGQTGKVTVNNVIYDQEMPGKKYTEVQITNIINYINHAWGNNYGVVSLEESTKAIRNCN
ncbi:MAG: mono/diheme cytochrome c family protein [Saprospiraceae bacterium]|jgi:mono/diheme cytochrome c family protein